MSNHDSESSPLPPRTQVQVIQTQTDAQVSESSSNAIPEYMSPSQLSMYTKCGQQYEFRYIQKIKVPPSGAMLRGRSLDDASNAHFRMRAQFREGTHPEDGFTQQQFVEYSVESHKQEAQPLASVLDMSISQSIDIIAYASKAYHTKFSKMFTPRSSNDIQTTLKIITNSGVPVLGIIDLITTSSSGDGIIDTKLKGRMPKQSDVDTSIQLSSYSMMTGITTLGLAIVKPTGETNLMITQRDSVEHQKIDARYGAAWKNIHKGVALPAVPDAWYCSSKWCGYWDMCPYGSGGRIGVRSAGNVFSMPPVPENIDEDSFDV